MEPKNEEQAEKDNVDEVMVPNVDSADVPDTPKRKKKKSRVPSKLLEEETPPANDNVDNTVQNIVQEQCANLVYVIKFPLNISKK